MSTPTYMELSGLFCIAVAAFVSFWLGMGVAYHLLPVAVCS